ncbi:hypothetical protein GKC29_14540 [Micromonospora sp. WMMC415]|uniref:hypothetical protein n=1 Tax=Micromonospora sp. WMMC415 TaxID=2675222 RepID=UPI0012B4D18A|nr:hypothetical protein [Micromonospora sp. WMMC415]QGN47946.1 hypothetical protein GKC29_14540 [Micromonospora sp. WMMC415]
MTVLVGGLVTLAVTCVVQILVVPWVQGRGRRRERWEKDVTELLVVFEEEVPAAQYMQAVKEAHGEAVAADDLMAKVRLLVERVALVRREALYWDRLRTDVLMLEGEVNRLRPFAALHDKVSDEEFRSRLPAVEKALVVVLENFQIVSGPMWPPPTRALGRRWPADRPPGRIPKLLDTPDRRRRTALRRIVR